MQAEDSDYENESLSKSFGATIRRMRKDRGWSQADLGEQLGMSLSAVSKLENGRTTTNLDHLAMLSRAFETTPEALLAGHTDSSEARVLAAIRAKDTPEAVKALAEALGVRIDQIGVPTLSNPTPTLTQFETLGRHAAQLARSAAAIVATGSGRDTEALLSQWSESGSDG